MRRCGPNVEGRVFSNVQRQRQSPRQPQYSIAIINIITIMSMIASPPSGIGYRRASGSWPPTRRALPRCYSTREGERPRFGPPPAARTGGVGKAREEIHVVPCAQLTCLTSPAIRSASGWTRLRTRSPFPRPLHHRTPARGMVRTGRGGSGRDTRSAMCTANLPNLPNVPRRPRARCSP